MPATDGKTISINIRAITGELTSGLNKARGDVRTFGRDVESNFSQIEASTERISRLWRAAFEAFLGFEAVKMLRGLALAAADAADHLDVAARVAKNFGHALDPVAMEKWIDAFARSARGGGYSVNEMRESVQLFAALGLDQAQIQRAIADTTELAASRNMDFAQATTVVRMALTGHVEMLTRYGVISREAAKGIKTVEQAMRALEKASNGAAEERANGLIGAFGRLSTAMQLLAKDFGTALEPFFEGLATALTGLANLLDSIPAPVMRVLGTITALGVSLAALVLILPAIAKGLAIMREGFALLQVVILPVITIIGRLIATLGLATTGFEAFTIAEIASMAPIAALIIAIAGIAVALVEMTNHMDHVKTAWNDFCTYLSQRFHDTADDIHKDTQAIVNMMSALASGNPAKIVATWKANAAMTAPGGVISRAPSNTGKLGGDLKGIENDIVGDWKKIASKILGFFTGAAGAGKAPTVPGEAFTGNIPGKTGKGKDTSAQQAENALKNFDEATKNWLASFAAKVDAAKAGVDISSEKLADFDVRHPANVPMSQANVAERQALVNDQLQKERDLRAALLQQQKAETTAAGEYRKIAESISTHLKNHDALVRQALDGARQHAKAAQDVYLNYLKVGTELDSIIAKERERRDQAADNAAQLADDRAQLSLDASNIRRETQGAELSRQVGIDRAAGRGSPKLTLAEDQLAIQMAELAKETAVANEAMKQTAVAEARKAYDITGSIEDANKLTAAMNALNEATLGVIKADNTLAETQAKFMADQNAAWNQLINSLIQKAQVPGLQGSAEAGFSFNPLGLLFDALEKTQMFGDVMNTVTAIVNTFAQAMNAFRPIIDALLDVVRAVVNVFIFLYNEVARILDLFGLQIQQLQYLTDAMSGLVPLISIVHEIPTLNELAAGRLGSPLSTTPQGYNNIGQTNGGQNTLMRVVEILVGILAAMIVEKVLTGMSLNQAIQSTLHLIGINMGQRQQTVQMTAENAQARALATTLSAKQTALTQAIGAKAAGMTQLTNTLLQQILLTLQQMLVSLQTQSAGGLGGIFGALLGGSSGLGAVGALGGIAGAMGQVLGPMAQAAQGVSNAMNNVTNALQRHAAAVKSSTDALLSFGSELYNATTRLRSLGGSGSARSFSLGAQTSRYHLDMVPNTP